MNFPLFKASASGIEAHMREVVKEAEGTVEEIKRLSVLIAKIQLSMLIRHGRLGGYKHGEQEKYRAEILSILGQMGVPESEKAEAMRDVHRFTLFDLYFQIVAPGHRARTDIPHEVGGEWAAITNREMDKLPSAEEFEAVFKKAGMWRGEVKERVEDFRYYAMHKRRRRPISDEDEQGNL